MYEPAKSWSLILHDSSQCVYWFSFCSFHERCARFDSSVFYTMVQKTERSETNGIWYSPFCWHTSMYACTRTHARTHIHTHTHTHTHAHMHARMHTRIHPLMNTHKADLRLSQDKFVLPRMRTMYDSAGWCSLFFSCTTESLCLNMHSHRHGSNMCHNARSFLIMCIIVLILQWIPFVLRKTLFDFIKSCGSQIRLKISEVAFLGLLYSLK